MADAIPAGPTTASIDGGRPPQATTNVRSVAIRIALLGGVLGFVFGILLPRIVDYDEVVAALAGLTAGQLLVLAAITAAAYVVQAAPCRIMIEGLSWPHAVEADLAARAVASTIPRPTSPPVSSCSVNGASRPVSRVPASCSRPSSRRCPR
jgi:hypothetical protein